MKDYCLGCNYWASNAGTEMWNRFDANTIRKDFSALRGNGVEYLRVFPIWRDFQPVEPVFECRHVFVEWRLKGEVKSQNPWYLDEEKLSEFKEFCKIADEYGMKLIVGLLTGWMSGRLFIPSALYDRNLYSDPLALYLEQLFVSGLVNRLRDEKSIVAWDLGNECNGLDQTESRMIALNWTATISNAIRAADRDRPLLSGMHSLRLEKVWNIRDQAAFTDILTTHPYPYWVAHCSEAEIASEQILLQGTCETQYYTDIGKKPCLVEEIGTMGPMVCDDETAANFLRVNLISNWIHGAKGVLWWCAFDQLGLDFLPYEYNMDEVELGMMTREREPKPVLSALKSFSDFQKNNEIVLSLPQIDAVCLLTFGQDHWGVAHSAYVMAKQAGLQLKFAYDEIPDAPVYLMPSVSGIHVISSSNYTQLKEKIKAGATLYLSMDDGLLSEFSDLCGVKVVSSKTERFSDTIDFEGVEIRIAGDRQRILKPVGAKVLAKDQNGNPMILVCSYGKGKVILVNFPLEKNLIGSTNGFDGNQFEIYRKLLPVNRFVSKNNPKIGLTVHPVSEEKSFVALVNYSGEAQQTHLQLTNRARLSQIYYGNAEQLEPYGFVIFEIQHK